MSTEDVDKSITNEIKTNNKSDMTVDTVDSSVKTNSGYS